MGYLTFIFFFVVRNLYGDLVDSALTLRQEGHFDEALHLLDTLSPSMALRFDQAITLFAAKRYLEAESLLENEEFHAEPLSQLWRAKIAIEEGKFAKAKRLLDAIQQEQLSADHWRELLYSRGDAAYRQKNWKEAAEWLEKALPARNQELADWLPKTVHLLNQTYLKQTEDPLLSLEEKTKALANAETLATRFTPSILDIARVTCAQARLRSPSAFTEGRAAFERAMETNPELKAEALLLLADNIFWQAEKLDSAELFQEATHYFQEIYKIAPSPQIQAKVLMSLMRAGHFKESEQLINALEKGEPLPPAIFLLKVELVAKTQGPFAAIVLLEQKELSPSDRESQLWLWGNLLFQAQQYGEAEKKLAELIHTYPHSPHVPAALYWAGRAVETEDREKMRSYFHTLYDRSPSSPLAPQAYFFFYSTQEYLLGNRASIKHLHGFKERFPHSPIVLTALYLEGLDALHDRQTAEGKFLSRKNLTLAIEAFQEVESRFDQLLSENVLSEELPKWRALRYQAMLEKAKANFAIAEEAKGAKKEIYLDYAEELFLNLKKEFSASSFHPVEEESLYYLALTQKERAKFFLAHETFIALCHKYRALEMKTGYYLSKSLYQLGKLASRQGHYAEAIGFFDQAKEAAPSPILSNDEQLLLLIDKGEALRLAGDLDQAMLVFSEAANYPAVSHLRLKAMLLRAEIYLAQGRLKLARKQLESLKLKGGEWAMKAEEILDQEFGYD